MKKRAARRCRESMCRVSWFGRDRSPSRPPEALLGCKGVLLLALVLLMGCGRTPPPPTPGALRLVSTAPNLTELMFAIGADGCLVGRTDVCDYPPESARIPAVGGFATPRLEPLLAARPTHVLESTLEDLSVEKHLASLGIPLVHVACAHLDDIPAALLQLGDLTGRLPQAQALADIIRAGFAQARADSTARTPRPRVFLLLAPESPITAGGGTFISELLTLAGGDNVAADVSPSDYFRVTDEWLLTCDPDIILCLFDTQGRDPAALFSSRVGWQALGAVTGRRVRTVANPDTVVRPGPRVLEGLAQLKACLGG